jgi:hypothetical protein
MRRVVEGGYLRARLGCDAATGLARRTLPARWPKRERQISDCAWKPRG